MIFTIFYILLFTETSGFSFVYYDDTSSVKTVAQEFGVNLCADYFFNQSEAFIHHQNFNRI